MTKFDHYNILYHRKQITKQMIAILNKPIALMNNFCAPSLRQTMFGINFSANIYQISLGILVTFCYWSLGLDFDVEQGLIFWGLFKFLAYLSYYTAQKI